MNPTINLLKNYFGLIIHPFKTQKKVGEGKPVAIPSLVELISISWGFVVLQAFYSLAGLNLSALVLKDIYKEDDEILPELLVPGGGEEAFYITVYFALFMVVIFPLLGFFYVKLWHVIIRFFSDLFGRKDLNDNQIEIAASSILASNVFLLFPIVGELFQGLTRMIYLFAGLRDNLGFTPTQSVVVLLSPLLILILFFAFCFTTLMLVLSGF